MRPVKMLFRILSAALTGPVPARVLDLMVVQLDYRVFGEGVRTREICQSTTISKRFMKRPFKELLQLHKKF